jgi:hypothetical protein
MLKHLGNSAPCTHAHTHTHTHLLTTPIVICIWGGGGTSFLVWKEYTKEPFARMKIGGADVCVCKRPARPGAVKKSPLQFFGGMEWLWCNATPQATGNAVTH